MALVCSSAWGGLAVCRELPLSDRCWCRPDVCLKRVRLDIISKLDISWRPIRFLSNYSARRVCLRE